MTHGRDRALHNKNVGSRVLRDTAKFYGALRNGTDGRQRPAILDLPDASCNQILLHRLLVDLLQ